MKRIEEYLEEEELNMKGITYDDKVLIEQGVCIEIKNGNFSWGINKISQEEEDAKEILQDKIIKPIEKDKNTNSKKKEEKKD